MRPELAARLTRVASGDFGQKSVRTYGTLERDEKVPTRVSKKDKQIQWRPNSSNCSNTKMASAEKVRFGVGTDVGTRLDQAVVAASEPDPDDLAERAAMAAGGVPEPYLDAWARLEVQRPFGIDEAGWRRAIDGAGWFLDRWGCLAVEFGWTAGDLFDVPRDGKQGGLVWFLAGEPVRSLGPEHAITISDQVFDRSARGE